jgi:hypothetical protein
MAFEEKRERAIFIFLFTSTKRESSASGRS